MAIVAVAATTSVQDTVYTGSGALANCTLQIYGQAMDANGTTVIVSKTQTKITNGVLSVPLQPNDTANPQGTSYRVTYACNDGSAPTETWVVPTSAMPVTLVTVRQVSVPTPILDYFFRGIADSTLARRAAPFKITASNPTACTYGDVIVRSDQGDGTLGYMCNNVGTWVAFGGGGSGGLVNSAANIGGAGVGLFYQLSGGELQFFKIHSTDTILSITPNGNDHVDLGINPGNIDHQTLFGVGSNTHSQIDAHIANTSNPHATTAAQVGAEVPLSFSTPLLRTVNTISLSLDANGFLTNNSGSVGLTLACADQQIPKFNASLVQWQCAADGGAGGSGITTINTQSGSAQTLVTGTSGSDFAISSSGNVHTFNLPTASASARGLLSSANWSMFNAKESVLTFNGPLSRSVNAISCTTCEVTTAKNAVSGYAGLDSGSRIAKAQAPSATVYTDAANSYTAGLKQTFSPSASTAGIKITSGADPSTPAQGDLWINSTLLKWRGPSTSLTAVDTTRTVSAVAPLVGGGTLGADISLSCPTCTTGAAVAIINPSVTFTAQTDVLLTHNLGNTTPVIYCWDNSSPKKHPIEYGSVDSESSNAVTVHFPTPQTGSCQAVGNTVSTFGIAGIVSDSAGNLTLPGDITIPGAMHLPGTTQLALQQFSPCTVATECGAITADAYSGSREASPGQYVFDPASRPLALTSNTSGQDLVISSGMSTGNGIAGATIFAGYFPGASGTQDNTKTPLWSIGSAGDFSPLLPSATIAAAPTGAVRNGGGTVATYTTTGPHHLQAAGETVTVTGVTDTTFNATCTVASVPTSSTFTCANLGTGSATSGSGSMVLNSDLGNANHQVGSLYALTAVHGPIYGNPRPIDFTFSPYRVEIPDTFIRCDATSGAVVINLPAAVGSGREITVKKLDSTTNACTPTRAASDLIDGATSFPITSQFGTLKIIDSGAAVWNIVTYPVTTNNSGAVNSALLYAPTCTRYTVSNNGTNFTVAQNGGTAVAGIAIPAATTASVVLFALPSKGQIISIRSKTATAFSGTGFTTATLSVGDSVGGNTYYTSTTYDLFAAVSVVNFQEAMSGFTAATTAVPLLHTAATYAGSNVIARLTANQAWNANPLTGAVDITACWLNLP